MNEFSDRLHRDLGHIADRATPSPTAWDAIQTRIAEQADQPETEIIMLEKNPNPPRPTHTKTWILSAAAAVILILGAVVALNRSSEDSSTLFAGNDDPAQDIAVDDAQPDDVAPDTSIDVEPVDNNTAQVEPTPAPTEPPVYSTPVPTPSFTVSTLEQASVDSLIASFNSGDGGAVMAMLAADAEFGSTLLDSRRSVEPVEEIGETLPQLLDFLADRNTQISLDGCHSAGAEQSRCNGSYSDEITSQVDGLPNSGIPGECGSCTLSILFAVNEEGMFTLLRLNPKLPAGIIGDNLENPGACWEPCRPTPWVGSAGYTDFLAWLDATYPADRALLMDANPAYILRTDNEQGYISINGAFPQFSSESRELWTQRVAEWLDSRS